MIDLNDNVDHSGGYTMKATDVESDAARKRLIIALKKKKVKDGRLLGMYL